MASRTALRALGPLSSSLRATRSFQTSSRRLADTIPLPAKKPVGAFRAGVFGFAVGSIGTGSVVYFYVLEEYKISNELLTEDIYSLQAAVQRTNAFCEDLEHKLDALEKRKK